jgi:hypothetical protein
MVVSVDSEQCSSSRGRIERSWMRTMVDSFRAPQLANLGRHLIKTPPPPSNAGAWGVVYG